MITCAFTPQKKTKMALLFLHMKLITLHKSIDTVLVKLYFVDLLCCPLKVSYEQDHKANTACLHSLATYIVLCNCTAK